MVIMIGTAKSSIMIDTRIHMYVKTMIGQPNYLKTGFVGSLPTGVTVSLPEVTTASSLDVIVYLV